MEKLLNKKQVAELLNISVKSLNHWVSMGQGPKPVHIGPTMVRFTQAEIETFIQKSMEEK